MPTRSRGGRVLSCTSELYLLPGYLNVPRARLRDASDSSMNRLHHSATPQWRPNMNADAAVWGKTEREEARAFGEMVQGAQGGQEDAAVEVNGGEDGSFKEAHKDDAQGGRYKDHGQCGYMQRKEGQSRDIADAEGTCVAMLQETHEQTVQAKDQRRKRVTTSHYVIMPQIALAATTRTKRVAQGSTLTNPREVSTG
ncbi:hypothetical protein JB92DRAFT_2831645 [Gautieria morchelliformis]|nr:hypothetical protein JB92DRAFT_2831645 [Gautieria morchelliformis]